MGIRVAREKLGRIFFQRCFYLFALLLALVAGVPFVEPTPAGRLLIGGVNAFLVVATVAAVGRTVLSFAIVLLLAAPALAYQYLGVTTGDPDALASSWKFGAARAVCVVEQLTGVMFLAILIARLAGVYPPAPRERS